MNKKLKYKLKGRRKQIAAFLAQTQVEAYSKLFFPSMKLKKEQVY